MTKKLPRAFEPAAARPRGQKARPSYATSTAKKDARERKFPVPTALVHEATAEKIGQLAECHHVSPAIVAGVLVNLGLGLFRDPELAERAGGECAFFLWEVICRKKESPGRHRIPVIPDLSSVNDASALAKDFGRPLDICLGQLIGMALPHCGKSDVMRALAGDPVQACFDAAAGASRWEWEDFPEVLAELQRGEQSGGKGGPEA